MEGLDDAVRGLELLPNAGRVIARRPSVLVYPLGWALVCLAMVPVAAWPILSVPESARIVVTPLSMAGFWLVTGLALTVLFGAMAAELHAVYEGRQPSLFAGLRVAWANRRQLAVLAVVLVTAGIALRVFESVIERQFGSLSSLLVDAIAGVGATFAIQVVVLSDRSTRESIERAINRAESTAIESLATTAAVRGLVSVGLVSGAAFGVLTFLSGVRLPLVGALTPLVGFLLVPFLTFVSVVTIDWLSRTLLYVHASGQRLPRQLRVSASSLLPGHEMGGPHRS